MAHHSKQLPPDEASDRDFPVFSENTVPPAPSPPRSEAPPPTHSKAQPHIAGRFRPGQSGNPKGRPRGSFNKSTMAARAILEANATKLMDKAVELALAGALGPLKLCLERLVPRDRPVQMPLPAPQSKPASAPAEILTSHGSLLALVAEGEITPQEARAISALLEARRRSWEATDLSDQLNRIEDRHDRDKASKGRPR